MYDIVIIGAGPVGLYASILAKLRGLKSLVIEKTNQIGGQLNLYKEKSILDLPGFYDIKAKDFLQQLSGVCDRYNVEISLNTFVNDFHLVDNKFFLSLVKENKSFELFTKTIILSNGQGIYNPITIDIDSQFSDIVHYKVENPHYFTNKTVAIFGGGDSALDIGNMLSDKAKTIYLIHRREDFRAKEESLKSFLDKKNCIVKTPYTFVSISDKNNPRLSIKNSLSGSVELINIDKIIVCFGSKPSNDNEIFLNSLERTSQGFLVNQLNETSIKNIFSIGNSCHYFGKNKNLVSGFGEAANVIHTINGLIKPEKYNAIYYSSVKNG